MRTTMEAQNENVRLFSTNEIKDWLSTNSEVQLPAVQRGFVWHPSQIEGLWDSLFRGYPIGSLMLSKMGDKYMLLDGQQRATVISLGYYNPWTEKHKKIGNVKSLPVIWFDIQPETCTESYKYVFRVVTRSHPWGYQLIHNSEKLSVRDRRDAKLRHVEKPYTTWSPEERFPYDSYLPIPLSFLLESDKGMEVIGMCKKYLGDGIGTKHYPADIYFQRLEEAMPQIENLLTIIHEKLFLCKIPAIVLSQELLLDSTDQEGENESTLFVRLNRGGTQIDGEELIYSIYKSIFPQSKDLVENMGNSIFAPSRIITLVTRLALSDINGKYVDNISLSKFRSLLKTQVLFEERLKYYIGSIANSPIAFAIEKMKEILSYNDVPNVVIKKFVRESPNGCLILLRWLTLHPDIEISQTIKTEISARIYRNYFFGDINYLADHYWNEIPRNDFWTIPVENIFYIYQYPLISPRLLENFLISRLDKKEEDHTLTQDDEVIWEIWSNSLVKHENWSEDEIKEKVQEGWFNFLNRLLSSRSKSLILLAQREYINKTFREYNEIEDLDDTNTPWDWDHIYPSSWVYGKWYIDNRTRRWEWRIGNFRAMDLTDNRSENNNKSPAERFPEPNADYFIKENDLQYWAQLDKEHRGITEGNEEYIKIHAKAIITRSVNIYENFLNMFSITL